MKFLITSAIALLPQLGCFALLAASIYPNGVESAIVLFFVLVIVAIDLFIGELVAFHPVAILIAVAGSFFLFLWLFSELRQASSNHRPSPPNRLSIILHKALRWLWMIDAWVIGLTIIFLSINVPLKWSFSQVESSFSWLVGWDLEPGAIAFVEQQFGPYYINEIAHSELGGIYLWMRPPSFVPSDRTNYGFAYRPNSQGSPFGGGAESDRDYEIHPIYGDWYWFQDNFGSDDWRDF